MWDTCEPDFWIKVIVITILIFLIFFALYWEWADYQRVFNLPSLDKVPADQKEKFLQFLACYNYNNGPQWREVYIATIIIALILLFAFGPTAVSFRIGILILFIIFIIFYGILSLNSYHLQRLICNKADPPYTVL